VTDQNNQTSQLPNRLVTLRWLDTGTCPDETLASLVERYRNPSAEEMIKTVEGMTRPVSMTIFVHGNAVDVRFTSFHGIIDLDRDLYPVLTNARATNEQVFSKAAFSLEDMGMDSGEKLFCLQEYIRFVQHAWALPGSYIGLSMHVVREIANLAYWKNWALEFRLDKRGNALVMAAHFLNLQDRDFVINIFRENDPELNPYPLMKEWLRFFRSIVQEVAELWTIRIVVNESIAEKIGCLNDDDVVITNEEILPYPGL
jgi:hypothetical protein